MSERLQLVIDLFSLTLVSYFFVLNGIYLVQGLVSLRLLRQYVRRLNGQDYRTLVQHHCLPPISILIPCYNEEHTCSDMLHGLSALHYPEYEILLINDGSSDGTLAHLQREFALEPALHPNPSYLKTQTVHEVYRSRKMPRLWVIDKDNGGKADALNAGLNYCQTPFYCAVDADTLLEPDALTRIVYPFMAQRQTIAVGGIVRILNGSRVENHQIKEVRLPQNLWARLQILEYLRAFLGARISWNLLGGSLIVSGAFGLFRHSVVLEAGGYATDTVGEDMELVVRLHRFCREQKRPYAITFVPDPVAWTQCPESLSDLYGQRERWQRGLVQSIWRHRKMLSNGRYGMVGHLSYPYYFFLEMLGPVLELAGYGLFLWLWWIGKISWGYALSFFLAAFGLGMLVSLLSLLLSEMNTRRFQSSSDLWRLLGMAVLENLFYRQLLSIWRSVGLFRALRGSQNWGNIRRQKLQHRPPELQPQPQE